MSRQSLKLWGEQLQSLWKVWTIVQYELLLPHIESGNHIYDKKQTTQWSDVLCVKHALVSNEIGIPQGSILGLLSLVWTDSSINGVNAKTKKLSF